MSGISLTASMRSNLLSLQNIASQQDIVQNRLATGLKVSSAIDNPSSYYTASSLNNRAADLTALLDAMLQGIQTIKAASEAIDSGTKFLEQAKAVANQAQDSIWVNQPESKIDYSQFTKLDKSWYQAQIGTDGAVVTTESELLAAKNAGKKTIVVYGNINLTKGIALGENQKLVGTEYFADINQNALYRDNENEHFSQLNFNLTTSDNAVTIGVSNVTISDLKITLTQEKSVNYGALRIVNANNISLHNLDVAHFAQNTQSYAIGGGSSNIKISGKMNIEARNAQTACFGIYFTNSDLLIDNTEMTINSDWGGIISGSQNRLTVGSCADINITAEKYGFSSNQGIYGGNNLQIDSGAVINVAAERVFSHNKSSIENPLTGKIENLIHVNSGVKIYWQNKSGDKVSLETTSDWISSATTEDLLITGLILKESGNWKNLKGGYHQIIAPSSINQYTQLLNQYDNLIGDSYYKGINLLLGQYLKINFNEDRSSKIDIIGVKADSNSLGLKTKEWKDEADIEKSISELEEAINILRGFASEFGNYYNIVTTRQDFTENLINVLTEGADKLTLADMNQESANMLALQTAQQLAVNSLSLASQASQSILRLF